MFCFWFLDEHVVCAFFEFIGVGRMNDLSMICSSCNLETSIRMVATTFLCVKLLETVGTIEVGVLSMKIGAEWCENATTCLIIVS